ncbi:hypothetical protein BLNAU_17448 [Blattamonas nauphoetae]|uniref:Uncharacterized protein n=1 Tax=Blattamonas nauphoetae TaxID=2049346 RepID=A0ABQ9X746_9EUKA|nr:hypothetical protein BLNAU_17448 [Blattamonas nauphoetae]
MTRFPFLKQIVEWQKKQQRSGEVRFFSTLKEWELKVWEERLVKVVPLTQTEAPTRPIGHFADQVRACIYELVSQQFSFVSLVEIFRTVVLDQVPGQTAI